MYTWKKINVKWQLMEMNNVRFIEKYIIEMYNVGIFQGYLKSISVKNKKVQSTDDKYAAKTYTKSETAFKDIERVRKITNDGLWCRLGVTR